MRKLLLPIGLGVLILAASAGGWYWWTHGRFVETTDNAYVESDISSISPKVAGYIHRLNVVDNQQVRAGDVLLSLDKAPVQTVAGFRKQLRHGLAVRPSLLFEVRRADKALSIAVANKG